MYMAPVTRSSKPASRPVVRRAVGLPVLLLAALVTLPWLLINALLGGIVLTGRFAIQAVDYAGQVALGR